VPHAEDGVAEAEDDMPVDPVQETDPVNASVVSREAVLGMFVPLFKEMADGPDYAYRPNKTVTPPKAINGASEKHTRTISRAPTKKSVHSDIQPLSSDQSTPSVTTKTGRKRSRPSVG